MAVLGHHRADLLISRSADPTAPLTYFNKVKFTRNFRSCSKNSIEKQYGRFVAMVTKDLQTSNLKFDQVMIKSLVLTWERNFKVTFGIFSVLVFQIIVLESYLDICLF